MAKFVFKDVLIFFIKHIMHTLSNKIQFVFNKISLSFIKDIKDKDTKVKSKLKKHYAIFDKSSDAHILFFIKNIVNHDDFKQPFDQNILENENILNFHIFNDIKVSDVVNVVDGSEHNVIKCYLYDLFMLSHLYTMSMDPDNETQTLELFNKSIKFIYNTSDLNLDEELDNVFDDDLKTLLQNVYETNKNMTMTHKQTDDSTHKQTDDSTQHPKELDNAFEFLSNSKIGDLAKEISQDIDIGNLNMENPEDLLNIDSIFAGNNPVLGDIIGKVSSKISNKIQSGELKQEDLMQEALSMMSKLNGASPFMDEMMKNAMNQGGGGHGPNLKEGKRRLKK